MSVLVASPFSRSKRFLHSITCINALTCINDLTSYKVENAVQVTWEFCRCAEQGRSAGRKCTKQGHPHGCHVEQAMCVPECSIRCRDSEACSASRSLLGAAHQLQGELVAARCHEAAQGNITDLCYEVAQGLCYSTVASSADISTHCDAGSVLGMSERPPARKGNEPLASKEDALIECSELHSVDPSYILT